MGEINREVNLDFLYKVCGCRGVAMSQCLKVPEVRKRIIAMMARGEVVDARAFVEILSAVYNEFLADRKSHKDFHFRNARTVIKQVSAKITAE